ncbi:flagellar biosynthesis protein FlhF [Planococcus salinus]|uniref:Flagellar biosynthesis protein FlhF n=1 Tax=Planococcus salinus TaxID=1848460 RepID=A0A3M8P551_9BACL|nr:flagellar biosynthesis protein FlhF [Planococcus salinus]RNF38742.1 flagellar biosynthesis protein FlhF [Planococcus salinus]
MRLKTYTVNNITEAMPMIKRDLGSEALILNTKKVKKGGLFGFFQKEKLEVIAAIETRATEKTESREKPQQQPQKPVEEKVTSELIDELKNIKQFMMQSIDDKSLPESLASLNRRLVKQDIDAGIRSDLMAKLLLETGRNPECTEQQIEELARQEIIRLIEGHQQSRSSKDPDFICFIGPTGVGKTTTIAKIAADYMLREGKKVGLITSDTYRIAAVEQLKTYAGILDIPIKVVESSADLNEAMEDLAECEIILMDTAGRNYQQKQYIEELELLLPENNKVQINLVLSLTSKYEDMKKIIDNFQTIKMDQLLLTKKDETSSSGAILNLVHDYSIPIRYIANGQNVPDDILAVTPELIADFVLGDDDNG